MTLYRLSVSESLFLRELAEATSKAAGDIVREALELWAERQIYGPLGPPMTTEQAVSEIKRYFCSEDRRFTEVNERNESAEGNCPKTGLREASPGDGGEGASAHSQPDRTK